MRYVEGLTSVEGGYGRTGSRSPMQWDNSLNCGFSTAPAEKLYIPLDSAKDRPAVIDAVKDENSIYNEVRRLISVRHSHAALDNLGEIEFVFAEKNAYPLAYLRQSGDEKILVIINPANEEKSFKCGFKSAGTVYSLNGEAVFSDGVITVPPCSAGFYKV